MRRAWLAIACSASGCATWHELDRDALCTESAAIVAYRTLDCTGDEALANARYGAFLDGVSCTPPADDAAWLEMFECVDAWQDATCKQVLAKADDWAGWIEISPTCALYLAVDPSTAP